MQEMSPFLISYAIVALAGVLTVFKQVTPSDVKIMMATYQPMQNKYCSGIVKMATTYQTLRSCAIKCSTQAVTNCSGLAFSTNKPESLKCFHIIDDSNVTDRTTAVWKEYEFFYLSGKLPMTHWISPKPKLYFPLDNDTGSRHGPNPENVAFIGGGIVGNAFYNPIGGGIKSYYRLGVYNSPEYCFPVPASCPQGVTFSLWLKLLGDPSIGIQGLLTTRTVSGGGFKLLFFPGPSGLETSTNRYFDMKEEILKVKNPMFLENYGYGSWFHYLWRYKFDNNSLGNNMNLNLNGVARPESEKSLSGWGGTPEHDGRLDLAHGKVNENIKHANIMMDEIKIWQEMLTEEQAEYVYYAYLY